MKKIIISILVKLTLAAINGGLILGIWMIIGRLYSIAVPSYLEVYFIALSGSMLYSQMKNGDEL